MPKPSSGDMQHVLIIVLALIMVVGTAIVPQSLEAAGGIQGSPRIINLYLNWQLREEDLSTLAKWDAVVLDADQQARYPDRLRRLRQLNPTIKILAYLPSEEIAQARFSEPPEYPFAKLANRIQDQWYLRDPQGNQVQFWPGSSMLNVTDSGQSGQKWNEFFPQFIKDEIMSSGLWDGVFLDNTFENVSSMLKSPIDLDRNGVGDTNAAADAAWRAGMTKMLRRIRELNPQAIVMGNGGGVYSSEMNGALFERFPSWSWGPNWRDFRTAVGAARSPNFTSINVNTENQERPNDFKLMRYGLTSAMVGGGWYSFDKGDWNHDVLWWYDEYEASLGAARGVPRLIQGGKGTGIVAGVWQRDFDQGIALVNSSETVQKVPLAGVYEKLRGKQDTTTNNGSLITSVELQPRDGVLLMRKTSSLEIRGTSFTNGTFVRAYNANGDQQQNGFFAQRADAPSGAVVVSTDIDADGNDDIVIAEKGAVTVRLSSGASQTFRPFGMAFTGRLSLAVKNTNRDAAQELILGRDGGTPEVKVFNAGGKVLASWNAYHPRFRGGVRVASGDLDGDGFREVLTGAGPGGGPHIRIWKTDGTVWGGGFFAFAPSDSGGVSVAVGDVDRDGKDEIVVGSGQGTVPRVRIFTSRGILKKEIVLGKIPLAQGVQVSVSDIDGDGIAEILVSGLPVF